MSKEVELWVRSAQADFQSAGHRGASFSDLHTMCLQIEDMVQSIALGLNELTQVMCLIKDQIDHIETSVQAQQSIQTPLPQDSSSSGSVTAG
jgi:hypothetical protein